MWHVPISDMIRQALASYLENNRANGSSNVFGLWGNKQIDGVVYGNQIRYERQIKIDLSRPDKPTDNATVGSFNSRRGKNV